MTYFLIAFLVLIGSLPLVLFGVRIYTWDWSNMSKAQVLDMFIGLGMVVWAIILLVKGA